MNYYGWLSEGLRTLVLLLFVVGCLICGVTHDTPPPHKRGRSMSAP